jgi:hypothetical protein
MTLRDIIIEGLKAHGYDGLQNEDCGCGLDDLMPCDGDWMNTMKCEPAYRRECEGCPLLSDEDADCYMRRDRPGCLCAEKLEG